MSLDEEGQISQTRFESDSDSHRLVEDCMLLANKAAAKLITKGVFRNHASPDFKKIDTLLEDLQLLGLDFTYENDLANLIRNDTAKSR